MIHGLNGEHGTMKTVSVTCSSMSEVRGLTSCQWHSLRTSLLRSQDDSESHHGNSSRQLPRWRHKHGTCCMGEYVYVFCGKDGTNPLKDMWRLHVRKQTWEKVLLHQGSLPSVQGHTAVAYKRVILLFGGTFSDTLGDIQLWTYNTDLGHLHEVWIEPGAAQPLCRRDHSAVIYNNLMYVYGGFINSAGASQDLWAFNIDEEEWTELTTVSQTHPGLRYGHSAVVANNSMWLYGGMSGLHPRSDVWKYNFLLHQWNRIKAIGSAPSLSGHTASVIYNQMVIVGGNCMGKPVNLVWSFTFDTCTWQKLTSSSGGAALLPNIAFHSCMVVSLSSIQQTANITRSTPHLKGQATHLSYPERFKVRPLSSPSVVAKQRPDFHHGGAGGAGACIERRQVVVSAGDSMSGNELQSLSVNSCNNADVRVHVSLTEPLMSGPPNVPSFYHSCWQPPATGDVPALEGEVETLVKFYNNNGSATMVSKYDTAAEKPERSVEGRGCCLVNLSSHSPVLTNSDRRKAVNFHILNPFKNDVFLEDLETADVRNLDEVKISYPSKNPFLSFNEPRLFENNTATSGNCADHANNNRNTVDPSAETTGFQACSSANSIWDVDPAKCSRHIPPGDEAESTADDSSKSFWTAAGRHQSDLPVNSVHRPQVYRQPSTSLPTYYRDVKSDGARLKKELNAIQLFDLRASARTQCAEPSGSSSSRLSNSKPSIELETSFVEDGLCSANASGNIISELVEGSTSSDTSLRSRSGSMFRSPHSGYVSPNCHMSCYSQVVGDKVFGSKGGQSLSKMEEEEVGEPFLLVFGGRTEGTVHPKPLAAWKGVLF